MLVAYCDDKGDSNVVEARHVKCTGSSVSIMTATGKCIELTGELEYDLAECLVKNQTCDLRHLKYKSEYTVMRHGMLLC